MSESQYPFPEERFQEVCKVYRTVHKSSWQHFQPTCFAPPYPKLTLISVAIELLQETEVDWGDVKNVTELRQALNLPYVG